MTDMTNGTPQDDNLVTELAALRRSVEDLTARIDRLESQSADARMPDTENSAPVAQSIGSRAEAAWRALRGDDSRPSSASGGEFHREAQRVDRRDRDETLELSPGNLMDA